MNNLIDVDHLVIRFPRRGRTGLGLRPDVFNAVDDVSFSIARGETFGLVGESGSGKSTIGKAILGYLKPANGEIRYDGTRISGLREHELLPYRRRMQSMFQDPYSALDPSMTVREIISEPMEIHYMLDRKGRKDRAAELLKAVGMAADDLRRYPHEFSGGQRQRIAIARALSVNPEFVMCDEPISALDVSLQAHIVYMLRELQQRFNLTYLFISHQLQVVQKLCDHIGVTYLGSMMERGTSEMVYGHPSHPYTRMLLSSMLEPDPDIPSLDNIIPDSGVQQYAGQGCRFANRCPCADHRCQVESPDIRELEPGHYVRCFRPA